MATRFGLVQGLVQGTKYGINYWEGGSVPPATGTLYEKITNADVGTFFQGRLGSAADYSSVDGWNFDAAGSSAADFGGFANFTSTLATVASPHGRSVNMELGSDYWTVDNNNFNMTTDPFAFIVRIKFLDNDPGGSVWFGRNGVASPHYQAELTVDGFMRWRMKQFGSPAVVDGTTSMLDGRWRWIILGRSVANEKMYFTTADEHVETAFTADKNLNGAAPLRLGPSAGVCAAEYRVDHLLVFQGDAAENIYTNRAAIHTSVLNDIDEV